MTHDSLEILAGLGVVAVLAVGAVLLLLRMSGRPSARHGALVLGYPPDLFPARRLVQAGPLLALAEIQGRLLSIYQQLPVGSEMALWLEPFLNELREIMNTAYRVLVITEVYGRPARLEKLIAEVEQLEAQVAEHITHRLLAREGDAHEELLEARLAMLRLCMEELGEVPEGERVFSKLEHTGPY